MPHPGRVACSRSACRRAARRRPRTRPGSAGRAPGGSAAPGRARTRAAGRRRRRRRASSRADRSRGRSRRAAAPAPCCWSRRRRFPGRRAPASSPSALGQRVEGARRRLEVELEVARQQELRRQPPEERVGVGHRRLRPAAAVAGRPGIGARALRADLEDAGGVDPGQAAAARPDRPGVHHRERDRDAVLELLEVRERRLAAGQQARLEARPAHVAGDQIAEPELAAERARGHDPARRARADERDRLLARLLRAHHAAVRAQDEELLDAARARTPARAPPCTSCMSGFR